MASDKSNRTSRRQLSFNVNSEASACKLETTRNVECALCHRCNVNMTIPEKWRSEPAHRLVASLGVALACTICSACRKDDTRRLGDDTYIPRWEKGTGIKSMCCVSECTEVTLASLSKPKELIHNAFQQAELQAFNEEVPSPTPLCKRHYHIVYNSIQPSRQTSCTTCGTTLKYTNYRTCSNPSKIEEYLRQHTDFEGHTHENDKVCFTCYKSHLIILQTSNCTSRDADLEQIIYNISKQIPISPVGSVKETIDRAINAVTIEVGKLLLQNNVILLPAIQDLVHEEVLG